MQILRNSKTFTYREIQTIAMLSIKLQVLLTKVARIRAQNSPVTLVTKVV